ncbi:hypothetical protein TEA_029585 [Camellia sinensis var. sinensis]|uniref:Ribosomal protein L19 n=1 Tax=Camellia sinensis var. sinensis TaxID=542762 RepID=A0A4V3WLH0_CAMSN|nr:hypothetical protein TEA_029585 [Camellia sinensis var. sinensis]
MQSFCGRIRLVRRHATNSSKIVDFNSAKGFPLIKPISLARIEERDVKFVGSSVDCSNGLFYQSLRKFTSRSPLSLVVNPFPDPVVFVEKETLIFALIELKTKPSIKTDLLTSSNNGGILSVSLLYRDPKPGPFHQSMALQTLSSRCITTVTNSADAIAQGAASILDKEAVEEVRKQKELPDIKPGYIIQLKVEVPDNKRRVSILKGIVIARRNAGLNTTFRLRRLVAGVGVESLFPLYSPNIKEIKVLDKKRVRRAKLYYLRDRMNPLKK